MKFSDILGQEKIKERLRRMVDSDHIPHALLLSGEVGVPKLALAQALAQYIHCTNKTNGDSCGMCPSCIQHQTFNHADTYFSFPTIKKDTGDAGTTSDYYIDQWKEFLMEDSIESYERWVSSFKDSNKQPVIYEKEGKNIISKMSLSTYSSKYKVLIMWLPEKLKEECANKLLKLIEEPSSDSIFIFVSDNKKAILPTIYSRLQDVELKRLPSEVIAQYIVDKYSIDYQDALAVSAAADGNVNLAIENLLNDSENKEFFQQFTSLMRLAYSRDLKKLRAWSESVNAYKREKTRRFLSYSARMIRENFIYNIHNKDLNFLTHEEEAFSTRFSPFINQGNVMQMMNEFTKADIDIAGNCNGKITLFDLAIRITILIKR